MQSARRLMVGVALAIGIGILAWLPACALLGIDKDDAFEGHYSLGFEVNAFQKCGSAERWWVVSPPGLERIVHDLSTGYDEIAEQQYEPVFVRLRGHIGSKGRFGHLGAYAREFTLTEVVTIRKATAGDCN